MGVIRIDRPASATHDRRMGATGRRLLVTLTCVASVALLAAALTLQLLSGGVRPVGLGPGVAGLLIGALGCLLALRRPALRLGQLMMATGTAFALGTAAVSTLDYGSVHPVPRPVAQASFAAVSLLVPLFIAGWTTFIVWFPDGRFPSNRWRAFVLTGVVLGAADGVAVWLAGPADRVLAFYPGTAVPAGAGGPFADTWPALAARTNLLLLFPLIGIAALVQRYRAGGAVVRQQVRWVLVALVVNAAGHIVGGRLGVAFGNPDAGSLVGVATQPLTTVAATVAVLRYRLWEIDLVVSRALVYGVLWAVLSGLLLVPALAAGLFVGGRGAGAAVGIALLVTVVFHPARRRLEALAQRMAYRHRARPYVLLSGFWETLRGADLDRLGPLVADALRTGLHVEWAGVWLYLPSPSGGTMRPLGVTGAAAGGAVCVSASTAEQLYDARTLLLAGPPAAELDRLWRAPPEAVVPLVASDEMVGLVACGTRRGDRLRPADFELLELLARECALRMRNLRLESQLRERLTQIEAQAAELSRSRQRLVTAQDAERRRIERDLHDGVQQQLVSLAARLHRVATDGPPQLADLASEAEQAVFALQELGRGIYPSVLADRGLPAALRTQAARVPATVRIEVDDALLGRRLDRDVEAALYFVASEALTNAYKHAPGAALSVWLRTDDGVVDLDVVDDGPGFAGATDVGTGLQNMHDRVAAVGGTLAVHSEAGRGTRVTASVPTASAVPTQPHQPVAADSRR